MFLINFFLKVYQSASLVTAKLVRCFAAESAERFWRTNDFFLK